MGVLGAGGTLGSEICRAVSRAPDLELAARVGCGDSLEVLVSEGVEVAVDFTEPAATAHNLSFLDGLP